MIPSVVLLAMLAQKPADKKPETEKAVESIKAWDEYHRADRDIARAEIMFNKAQEDAKRANEKRSAAILRLQELCGKDARPAEDPQTGEGRCEPVPKETKEQETQKNEDKHK